MEYFYRQYLSSQPEMTKVGAVYPGFHDFYAEGGWGDGFFFIDHKGGETLDEMIQMAIQYEEKGTVIFKCKTILLALNTIWDAYLSRVTNP